ncbi:succinate dehydrogenase/fumarate reductase iron-sulfur subunit [bacterium]|nr:MAG: succinate dehydrogenase/fumarate reductase iron-sulfur subunit [bacterium]
MNLTLHIWRQSGPDAPGKFHDYKMEDVPEHMSFLEMLDQLNEKLTLEGTDPVTYDHDCREGICGACGMVINGTPHGPMKLTTTCQLHMRSFKDGDELWLEPWRAKGFPVLRDLMVDRSSFDRIIQAGGFVSVNTGGTIDANAIPIEKAASDLAFDAAACIGCGACVAACPNASANLFTAAKISHLGLLPQGQPERTLRAQNMVATMDDEDFGHCSNHRECEAVCPKGISHDFITRMNRDFLGAVMSKPVER